MTLTKENNHNKDTTTLYCIPIKRYKNKYFEGWRCLLFYKYLLLLSTEVVRPIVQGHDKLFFVLYAQHIKLWNRKKVVNLVLNLKSRICDNISFQTLIDVETLCTILIYSKCLKSGQVRFSDTPKWQVPYV